MNMNTIGNVEKTSYFRLLLLPSCISASLKQREDVESR